MTTLAQIVAGLAGQLRTIDGLRVHDVTPGTVEYPAALITPPEIDYRLTMNTGGIRLELDVVVLVSAVADRLQHSLFDYLDWEGASSILVAIGNDNTLGVAGINAVVMSSRPLGLEEIAGYQAWGAVVRLIIHSTAA